ncbi:MAG: nucleoside hydrolase [Candidatus Krumholzibacteriota bacterium]|nr:nucleoside hydrolase [Candidatus Krumholzibacteriota bacterium]
MRRIPLALALVLAALLAAAPAWAHHFPRQPVIVDTDLALDDLRAIALLAQSEEHEIVAAVSSDGSSSPEAGARNLRAVLDRLGLADVPVAAGADLDLEPPPWRAMSETLGWSAIAKTARPPAPRLARGGETPPPPETAAALIARALAEAGGDAAYLCLGPMTNLAAALREDPTLAARIGTIVYYGTPPDVEHPDWNTSRDTAAARAVFAAGIPLCVVRLGDEALLPYDRALHERVRALGSAAARLIAEAHAGERVAPLLDAGHFRCWDETAALRLVAPPLFERAPWRGSATVEITRGWDRDTARRLYLSLLAEDLSMTEGHRRAVVLREYPAAGELLREDVALLAPEILRRHGREEWDACLLTNELHRHLGVWSLLGAKMGIRAREILGAGVDELRVVSHAGLEPPLSCFTDGLQVSTGASLGRGTISVAAGEAEPAAEFIDGERRLVLRVRPAVVARVRADIRAAVAEHGGLTPAYWRAVRAMALGYWRDIDRAEAFEVVE